MAKIKDIVGRFVSMAKRDPQNAPEVYRQAARTFIGLAIDPKNARSTRALHNIAMDFAQRASRMQPQPVTIDDFTDLLQETAQAYAEVGDDVMDLIARRREIHDERDPMAKRVSIAPETFNRDATLGRSAVIEFLQGLTPEEQAAATATGIAEQQTVAFWQGTKVEAQAMTVDVGMVNPPPPGQAGEIFLVPSVRAYGVVEFGSDGNKTSVKFDIGRGVRFTVVGNYVAVNVVAGPPSKTGTVYDPTAPITVGASLGAFAAPSQAPLIMTEYLDNLDQGAGNESGFILIPMKAVQLLPVQSNLAAGETATLEFYGYGGGTAPLATAVVAPLAANASQFPIPIPGDIAFVRVINNGATSRSFRLPFQLSL